MKQVSIHSLIRSNRGSYDSQQMQIIETLMDINVIAPTRLNGQYVKLLTHFPEVVRDIEDATSFVGDAVLSTRERIMLVVEGFHQMPTCRGCGARASFNVHAKRWNRYCGARCPHLDHEASERRTSKYRNKDGAM